MNNNPRLRTFIFLMVVSFVIIVLQQTVFNFKFFDNRKPELFTMLIINYAFWEEEKCRGYFFSSLTGFFEDVLTNRIFGLNIILKSTVFLCIVYLKDKIFVNNFLFKSLVSVVIIFLELVVVHFLSTVFSFYAFSPFGENVWGYLLINLATAPIFIFFLDKLYKRFVVINES